MVSYKGLIFKNIDKKEVNNMFNFTTLFILAMFNNNQEVKLFNNINALDYIKEVSLYTHKEYANKDWYREI